MSHIIVNRKLFFHVPQTISAIQTLGFIAVVFDINWNNQEGVLRILGLQYGSD
jgi:hypothetical protein